jgi:ubiquitin-protein ligase
MLRRKRGSEELSEEASHLTEQIKKFRITSTPGDLRLQNDILDFQKIQQQTIRIQESNEKSCIILTFIDMPPNCPHSYHIRVPKLYPHDPPQVTCMDPGFPCQYIDPNGKVHHPALGGSWTAINSLVDVAQILQEISSTIHQASLSMDECQPQIPFSLSALGK